jgi:predicted transcriptional regulator
MPPAPLPPATATRPERPPRARCRRAARRGASRPWDVGRDSAPALRSQPGQAPDRRPTTRTPLAVCVAGRAARARLSKQRPNGRWQVALGATIVDPWTETVGVKFSRKSAPGFIRSTEVSHTGARSPVTFRDASPSGSTEGPPTGGPEEVGATAGDLPHWLHGVYDQFEVMGKVVWCRYDRDDPPSVECAIEMWVRPDRRDEFERVLRQPTLPSKVSTSSFAEDGLLAVLSTPRPKTCPKQVVPWAPCDIAQCPLANRPTGPTKHLLSSYQEQGPELATWAGPNVAWATDQSEGPSTVKPEPLDRQFGGRRPSVRVMRRILETLHEAGDSCPPTRLQLGAHVNYTQLERYVEFMETLGLVTWGRDPISGRRAVCLTSRGRALSGTPQGHPGGPASNRRPQTSRGKPLPCDVADDEGIERALEACLARRRVAVPPHPGTTADPGHA